MNIRVGILNGNRAGWECILRQEGVPFGHAPGAAGEFSVMIACGDAEPECLGHLKAHCEGGGGVICSGQVYAALTGSVSKKQSIGYLTGGDGTLFAGTGIIDVDSMCRSVENAGELADKRGRHAALAGTWNGAPVVVLPFDPGELAVDLRQSTKSFYADHPRLPFERVSLVSKGAVRRIARRSLEYLHHRQGIPYIHLWYYPAGAVSQFCLRIDTDGASAEEVGKLSTLLRETGTPASWFLDVKSQKPLLRHYRSLAGHELGVHGFEHETYPEYERNRRNFSDAIGEMREAGFDPRGAASPFGMWNGNLQRVYEELGFEYSSEFSYDYDNLPSFPLTGGSLSPVLQVPVHPVSIGSLRRQGFGGDAMSGYFTSVIRRAVAAGEPVFIYHHPKNGHEDVLREIITAMRRDSIEPVTMSAFARWWRQRSAIRAEFSMDGPVVHCTGENANENMWLHWTKADGTESWTPLRSEYHLDSIPWRAKPAVPGLPAGIRRTRRFNPWIPLIRIEDFLHTRFR